MTDAPKVCRECGGRRVILDTRRVAGWGRMHNDAVRNYRGGPRPNMRTDYNEVVRITCPWCEGSGQERP